MFLTKITKRTLLRPKSADDRSFQQIAKELGIPPNRVKVIYNHAIRKIKAYLLKNPATRERLFDCLKTLDGFKHTADSPEHSTR